MAAGVAFCGFGQKMLAAFAFMPAWRLWQERGLPMVRLGGRSAHDAIASPAITSGAMM